MASETGRVTSRQLLIWGLAAIVSMSAFAIGRALDLPSGLVLLVAFLGAIVGTVLATALVLRLLGEADGSPPPPAPRGRGNGRKAR